MFGVLLFRWFSKVWTFGEIIGFFLHKKKCTLFYVKIVHVCSVLKVNLICNLNLSIKNLLAYWNLKILFEFVDCFISNNFENFWELYLIETCFDRIDMNSGLPFCFKDNLFLTKKSKGWNETNLYRFFDRSVVV